MTRRAADSSAEGTGTASDGFETESSGLASARDWFDRKVLGENKLPLDLRSQIESPQFRHNAANPLPVDVLVVDEASMVDLPLMAKLVDAVPPSARLILLGDPDQLVSVELGSVLGDVCAAARAGVRSQAATDALRAAGADCPDGEGARRSLTDVHVHLEHTWRYGDDSGIKAIATAIQANEGARVVALLDGETHQDVVRVDPPTSQHGWEKMLRGSLVERYTPAVTATAPEPALEALGAFRVLCAHRRGIRGVARVNDSVEAWLQDAGKIRAKELWYPGRPVMITRTDRTLKLRNGDVGIVGVDPDDPTGRLAWFPGERDPALRRFRTAALPEHDTVYATTVHKAQGSEYDEVLVILPDKRSPVVTRELLYTAVTRARSRVRVLGSAAVIEAAVGVTIERMTGLRQKLAAAPQPVVTPEPPIRTGP